MAPTDEGLEAVRLSLQQAPGLELAILFGSRARGDHRTGSDWDIGYVASDEFDPGELNARLALALRTEQIDLVDLSRATGLLRFRAARDGAPLHERCAGAFERYCLEAGSFWWDAEPVLRRAYEEVLSGVGP
jgi:predicted nucleotidyltransferase